MQQERCSVLYFKRMSLPMNYFSKITMSLLTMIIKVIFIQSVLHKMQQNTVKHLFYVFKDTKNVIMHNYNTC